MFTAVASGLIVILFLFGSSLQQEDVPPTKFSCQGRVAGYYADVDSGCQIYHMCDGLGRQFSYSCPNTTLFQQRMLICDHWYMVNCSTSEIDYAANLLIGQNKPFVEDSEKHPYYRTPRPDLLSQPTAAEFNIIYRKGKSQNHTGLNLVGVSSEDRNNDSSVTDKRVYHLPSHWSTEYSREQVTQSSIPQDVVQRTPERAPSLESNTNFIVNTRTSTISPRNVEGRENPSFSHTQPELKETNFENNVPIFRATAAKTILPAPRAINFNSNNLNVLRPSNFDPFGKKDITVNYKSLFKATTPVFPTKEELGTTESPVDDILNPPDTNQLILNFDRTDSIKPNNNPDAREDVAVNFKSFFKATTPVFPTKEELGTTESPVDGILNPPSANGRESLPQNLDNSVKSNNIDPYTKEEVIVNFKSLFKATTPVFPTQEELGTTESPVDDILNPPHTSNDEVPSISSDLQLPANKYVEFVSKSVPTDESNSQYQNVQAPSNDFLPPNSPSDSVTDENKYTSKTDLKNPKNKNKVPTREENEKTLKDLRKMFSIPDYDFQLDTASRASYDGALNSFQANPFLLDVQQRQHAS